MSDISKINPDGTEYNLKDATARTNIGNLASLHTTAKNDAVSAINEVKDEQANKADNDMVADAFNAAETYAEGDYCTYEGGLYKFKTSHSGAWDAADVDQIQIAGELSELKNTLSSLPQIKTFNYVNDQASPSGIFVVNIADVPYNAKVIGINGSPLYRVFMYYRDTHERLCIELRDAVSLELDTVSGINVNIDYIVN